MYTLFKIPERIPCPLWGGVLHGGHSKQTLKDPSGLVLQSSPGILAVLTQLPRGYNIPNHVVSPGFTPAMPGGSHLSQGGGLTWCSLPDDLMSFSKS